MTGPITSLVGVFLHSGTWSGTPTSLDFFGAANRTFSSLSTALQQVFFIGDGFTGTGTGDRQLFYVPTGADCLYLGVYDGGNWNNGRSFQVTVEAEIAPIPEPSTLLFFGTGLVGLIGLRWHRLHKG
jgi:hypothetical protein